MTLLDKMADEVWSALPGSVAPEEAEREAVKRGLAKALTAILTPTATQVHRMGAKALDGDQTGGVTIYPAPMWRAGVQFILEEQDREPEPDAETPPEESE